MTKRYWVLSALLATGCESGLGRQAKTTFTPEVAAAYSEAAPGVVVSDLGMDGPHAFLALCGQTPPDPTWLSQDLGFGCLREHPDLEGTSETVRVWVQPMPAGWDTAKVCASAKEREFYSATRMGPVADAGMPGDGGVSESDGGTSADSGLTDEGLALTPDPGWPQGTGIGSWHRDGSPCGGLMDAEITVSMP
jgi:hypothetical protein